MNKAKEPSMIIIEDTREQDALSFARYKCVEWQQRNCLPVGDYACVIDGSLSNLVFERKSKGDLWGTMASKEYERFKREYNKSLELGIKLVLIIECSISDVHSGYSYRSHTGNKRSKFLGSSMCKKLETIRAKHGLEVVYCNGRTDMKRYMIERWRPTARFKQLKKPVYQTT